MAKEFKPNPLGALKGEIIQMGVPELGADYNSAMMDQAPVHKSLTGEDTFKQDAMKPTSRADIEKRRGYFDSGVDLKGADMFKELGGGTGGSSKEFTDDKTA